MRAKAKLIAFTLVGVIAGTGLLVARPARARQVKELSTELRLRIRVQALTEQVHAAQVQLAQCRANAADLQARLDSVQLSSQAADLKIKREALESEIKKVLGASENDVVDWSTNPPTLKKRDSDGK